MKRIKAKYISFEDNDFIEWVLLQVAQNRNTRYNYVRNEHQIKFTIWINGRKQVFRFDTTKSDFTAVIQERIKI